MVSDWGHDKLKDVNPNASWGGKDPIYGDEEETRKGMSSWRTNMPWQWRSSVMMSNVKGKPTGSWSRNIIEQNTRRQEQLETLRQEVERDTTSNLAPMASS